jgi:hypothetical protein
MGAIEQMRRGYGNIDAGRGLRSRRRTYRRQSRRLYGGRNKKSKVDKKDIKQTGWAYIELVR